MSGRDTSGRLARYREHLDSLMGTQPTIYDISSELQGSDRILAITYTNAHDDIVTGFTYGLSLSDHQSWISARPELCIAVRAVDPEWATAAARMAGSLRGKCPFQYEQVVSYIQPLVNGSPMNCLLMAEPTIANGHEPVLVDVHEPLMGDADIIEIVGAYPIYASERGYIQKNGAPSFWGLGFDKFDPTRSPAV